MTCCTYNCNQGRNCPIRTARLSTPAELMAMAGPEPVMPAPAWAESLFTWAAVGLVATAALALGWIVLAEPLAGLWRTFLQVAGWSGLG